MLYECEYFLAIAKEKNLNRAAQALYISPSALSQFLSKLENRLGHRLFVREKNSLRLTEAGMVYYEAARQIEEIKTGMLDRLEQLTNPDAASIRIAVSGNRALRFATQLWPVLYEKFPNCTFYLSNDISTQIYEQIAEGTLDFGIIVLDYDRQAQFRYLCLHHDEVGLLIPDNHRVLKRAAETDEPMDIRQCEGETLLLGMKQSMITRLCKQYFKQQRFVPGQITYSMQGNLAEVARISGVIGMCPAGYVQEREGVQFRRLKEPVFYDLGIVCRKDKQLTAVEEGFLELAQGLKESVT